MSKKLITACLALVALAAFALPAVASAATNPTVTEPTGTVLDPTGKTCTSGLPGICLTATNIGVQKLILAGTPVVECSSSSMTAAMSLNTNAASEATIHTTTFTGTGAGSACTTTFGGTANVDTNIGNGTPWCLSSESTFAADEFQVRGGACGAASHSITFVLTTSTAGTCKYERTAAIKGTYKTDTAGDSNSDAILNLAPSANTEFKKESVGGGGVLCPATGQLEMSYTLETDTPGTTTPVWFS